MLTNDNAKFKTMYGDNQGALNKFQLNKVEFTNKYDKRQKEENLFSFEYTVGSRLHSNEPRCFQGVQLKQETPTCDFYCKGKDCLL